MNKYKHLPCHFVNTESIFLDDNPTLCGINDEDKTGLRWLKIGNHRIASEHSPLCPLCVELLPVALLST